MGFNDTTRRGVLLAAWLILGTGCQKAAQLAPQSEPEALTSRAAFDGEPDIAPNGRAMVYSAFGENDRDLFVHDGIAGAPLRALAAGPGDDGEPKWSPDGATIVFSSDRGGSIDVWSVAAAGGEPQRLTVEAGVDGSPDWSPDGGRIVFVSDRTGRTELWVLTLSTGTVAPVTADAPPATNYRVASPDWSGDRIVFSATVDGNSDLYVVSPEGGPWTALTSGPARERYPSTSSNGRIAFVSDSTSFDNLYILEPDGRITTVTDLRIHVSGSAWSPDGKALTFARTEGWALLSVPGSGGAPDTVLDARGRNLDPTWSPDAMELAYYAELEGQDDIWRVAVGEYGAGPITTNRDDDQEPDWSPVANRICFTARRDGNADVWIMDPSGIDYHNVTRHPAWDGTPRWTPDGRSILFVSDREGSRDIWIAEAAGGDARRITEGPEADASPTLVTDPANEQSWVVFESVRNSVRGLFKVRLSGGIVEPVTQPGSGEWHGRPAASPAEAGLVAFTRSSAGETDIYRMNVFSEDAPVLLTGDPGTLQDQAAWSPDGSRIAFQSGGSTNLWRVDAPAPVSADTP